MALIARKQTNAQPSGKQRPSYDIMVKPKDSKEKAEKLCGLWKKEGKKGTFYSGGNKEIGSFCLFINKDGSATLSHADGNEGGFKKLCEKMERKETKSGGAFFSGDHGNESILIFEIQDKKGA